ncbi:hypothetical protein CLM74_02885 [Stenotrophomonas sp. MYb57]|nr:hypothetical protein CLM74_02885 [Stenotrophomonas sp. MYb57]
MHLHRNRIFRNRDEKHPRMAWIYCRPRSTPTKSRPCHPDRLRRSVEGGVGPVAGVSAAWMPRPSPHGWVYGVPRNRTHPAIPQQPRCCRCRCSSRCLCGCRAPPGRYPSPGRAGRIGISAVIRSRRCASPSSTCTPPRKPPATPS